MLWPCAAGCRGGLSLMNETAQAIRQAVDGLNGEVLKAENDFQSFARRRGSDKAIAIDARAVRYVIRTNFNQGAAAGLRPMEKKIVCARTRKRTNRRRGAKRISISGSEAMPAKDVSRQRGAWEAAEGGKRSCAHANGLHLGGGYSIHQGSGGRVQARGVERDGYYIQFRAARNPDRFKRRQDAGWTYSHSVTS